MFIMILTLRCENYAISMLEQCENLNEVELFLETKTSDGKQHKDANYILAILDSRKKFVAHERFQYVLLKKFGETDQQVNMFFVHFLLLTQQKAVLLNLNAVYWCIQFIKP